MRSNASSMPSSRISVTCEYSPIDQGKAEALLCRLRRCFPELRPDVEDQAHAASSDQLDEWGERFADGKSPG